MKAAHVCLMRRMFEDEIVLTDEQKEGVTSYKGAGFMLMNKLLRGGEENFRKLMEDIFDSKYNILLDKITKYILDIEDVAKALPQRAYDIVLHRKGSGVGKDVQVGSKNEYDSLVSFATDEGMRTGESPEKYVEYQCVLDKDIFAIPIEVLCPKALLSHHPECEIFTLPFVYEVEKYDEQYRNMYNGVYESLVTMGNVKNIPVAEILKERLQELREYLKKKIKDKAYIDDVLTETQSKESTEEYKEQGYIENEDVEQISFSEMLKFFEENGKLKEVIEFDRKIQNDPNQYESFDHGSDHTRRVGFFARVIGENVGLSKEDMKILLYAVQNHDIGREHDWEDKEHGQKSVEKLKQIRGDGAFFTFGNKDGIYGPDIELVYFMMENHSKSNRENEAAIMQLPKEKQDRYRLMLNCLKDADKLDRIRLGKYDGLDASRLQLPFSHKIVRMAYEVNDVWTDIADRLDSKLYDLESIIPSLDKSAEIVDDRVQHPREIKIERRKKEYYDDTVIDGRTSEECLSSLVNKSEAQTTMSGLKGFVARLKNRVQEFFKGNQITDKPDDVK